MSFVNASLLLGGILVAAPVLLHLLMRRQPKRLVFPAIQFIKPRMDANRRTLQMRHWLLLFLRGALLALLAVTLARPSAHAAAVGQGVVLGGLFGLSLILAGAIVVAVQRRLGRIVISALGILLSISCLVVLIGTTKLLAGSGKVILGDQESPVAAALLVDTSARMQYRYQDQTRLQAAQTMAAGVLRQLPNDSQIAILDSRGLPPTFAIDIPAAQRSLERLQTFGVPRRLPKLLDDALGLLKTSDKVRREIYIFTDLTSDAWTDDSQALGQRMEEVEDALLYIVDVGVPSPKNLAIGNVSLSGSRISRGADLDLTTEISSIGIDTAATVELHVEVPDLSRPIIVDGKPLLPETQRRSRETVPLTAGSAEPFRVQVKGLSPGIHHGFLRLTGDDGLPFDNVRFFSVAVEDAWPILVVSGADAVSSFVTDALAPLAFRQRGEARFECRTVPQAGLANENLEDYAAVCLLDPGPFTPEGWEQLLKYVQQGGGLAMFLGRNATSAFESTAAQQLIGGKLGRQPWRAAGREIFLAPVSFEHPVMAEFRAMATAVPWDSYPVFRHWDFSELNSTTAVVTSFNNTRPAIVEPTLGNGRVLVATSPFSESVQPQGRLAWNEFFGSDAPWPTFVLVNEMMLHLVQQGNSRLNFLVGESVSLSNDPQRSPERYQLFAPDDLPHDVIARDSRLAMGAPERAGTYYLKGNRGGVIQRGFSVNLPYAASDLTRITPDRLDALLGAGKYRIARSQQEIVREVGEARIGREFYPYLLLILAFMLAVEHVLANRFYRRDQPVAGPLSQVSELPRGSIA